jgi:T5SS/PEP-CTERM-associated repeat protein
MNAAGGSAATTTNWAPAGLPGAVDDLVFDIGGSYSVTFGGTTTASRTHSYLSGTVTLSMTSPHTTSTGIVVADLAGDSAMMRLTTGSLISSAGVVVGDASGALGHIDVNDHDADLVLSGSADLTIGNAGSATLNIAGGGRVEVADQFIAGSAATSAATITIDGFTVAPLSISSLDVVGTSQSRIGAGGDVTMTITDGAAAFFAGDLVIANGSASTSSVTVEDQGLLDARLAVDGDLLIGRNTGAAAAGSGTLRINTGGQATVDGDTMLGDPDGGSGALILGGGTFTGPTIDVRSGSSISGTGTINADITNAGSIQPSGPAGLTLGGQLSNTTNGVSGTKLHFASTGSYIGSGVVAAAIGGDAGAEIAPTATLTMGVNTAAGISYNGGINVGSATVNLVDSNGAVLGGPIDVAGGRLSGPNGIGLAAGGSIRGRGTLAGNVILSGVLAPEGTPDVDLLTVENNLTINPSGAVAIELRGPGISDRVNVFGTATFGGTAELTLEPGYLPSIGEQMTLVNASAGRIGEFADLDHTPICTQYTIVLVYSSTAGIALIRPGLGVTSVGDVDRDGDHDLDDYDLWQPCMAGPGVLTPPPGCDPEDFAIRADFDGPACEDFDVDLRDFVVLQRLIDP